MTRWRYKGDDDDEQDRFEKIGKMGSKSRASKSKKSDLTVNFELKESEWPKQEDAFAARVVEVHKRYAFISPETEIGKITTNDVWLARVARKFLTAARSERNFIAVGDRVLCRPAEERERDSNSDLPQCIVLHLSPRKSRIARVDPVSEEREHVLACNVDQLLIVASFLAPRVKWGLIDRYLVLAEAERIDAIIIFNKEDLLLDSDNPKYIEDCMARVDYYRKLGYKVFVLQANAGKDLSKDIVEDLRQTLKGKISMFSGHSGVGKSSIINLFKPEIVQDVEPDSNIFYKGRHTTSYASFISIDGIGYVVDTPGIRSFVIEERDPIELANGFVEMRKLVGQCDFRSCRHIDEENCAVRKAVEDGQIAEWRYRNYCGILLGTTGREGRIREQNKEYEELEIEEDELE